MSSSSFLFLLYIRLLLFPLYVCLYGIFASFVCLYLRMLCHSLIIFQCKQRLRLAGIELGFFQSWLNSHHQDQALQSLYSLFIAILTRVFLLICSFVFPQLLYLLMVFYFILRFQFLPFELCNVFFLYYFSYFLSCCVYQFNLSILFIT